MSKRNLVNLSLLLLIFALAAIAVYKPGKDVAIKPTILTPLKSSAIHHIKINRHSASATEQQIEFKKTVSGWEMLKPYSVSANTFRINSILELLSTVSFSQNNLENLDLNTFGLKKPLVTITFNNITSLVFGHNKSLKNHRYIKIGSTLHLTADTFFYQLGAKSESYINHKVLSESDNIVKLTLPSLKLKNDNGKWNVIPKKGDLSSDSINQLISEWKLSQAFDVNKVKPDSVGKADIIVYLKNNKKIHFKIEDTHKSFNLINLDTGIRYFLSSDRKDKLLKLSNIPQEN